MKEVEEEVEARELIEEIVSRHKDASALYVEVPFMEDPLPADWIAEIKKPRAVDEVIDFLKEELARITKEAKNVWKSDQGLSSQEQHIRHITFSYQKMLVEDILDAVEDRSMDVLLGRVLKVGQKFSYIYDFGSSTYINLRVISGREGIVQNEKESVQLLAQNSMTAYVCVACGILATVVAMGYFYGGGIEDSVYCDACAKAKRGEYDAFLPIINSPRVGVL